MSLIVAVGLVQLQQREFGVVPRADALVAEVARELVDALEPADQAALQVQLRRDAQEQVHVQRVVVRRERPGGGAAVDRLQYGRFDFEKSAAMQHAAGVVDDPGALDEHVARLGIGEQVHVPPAIAGFDVGEAVEFLGRRSQGLAEQGQAGTPEGELAGLGAAEGSFDADDVAEVEQLGDFPALGDHLLAEAELEVAGAVADGQEHQVPEDAVQHDAAGGAEGRLRSGVENLATIDGQLLGRRRDVGVGGQVGEARPVWIDTQFSNLLELRDAVCNLITHNARYYIAPRRKMYRRARRT